MALDCSLQDYAGFLFEVVGADRRVKPDIVGTGSWKEQIIRTEVDITATSRQEIDETEAVTLLVPTEIHRPI